MIDPRKDFAQKNLITDNKIQTTMGYFDANKFNKITIEEKAVI